MENNTSNQTNTQTNENLNAPVQTDHQIPPTSNTGMAVLAYLGILLIIPLLTDAKNDSFVKFHIKQGLVLIVLFVAASIIGVVPILGWIVSCIAWIVGVVLAIVGIINAVNRKEKELPLIGKYSKHFNF